MGGAVSSLLFGGGKKQEAPAPDPKLELMRAEQKAKADADKKKAEDEAAEQERRRMSGNFGRRSLFTGGEQGYERPSQLGG
jgi:hypothetical protein